MSETPQEPVAQEPAGEGTPAKPFSFGKSCLGCFGILVLFSVIVGGCTALTSPDDGGVGREKGYAIAACEDEVRALLKAPATADFQSGASGTESPYTVVGQVDSENGFGATLRSEFTCSVGVVNESASARVTSFG